MRAPPDRDEAASRVEALRHRVVGPDLEEDPLRAPLARRVFLEVRADNPVARALYASEGFEAVGRRPHYYQPDDVDAIVMRLDLRGRGASG